jgi:hypothetical protein
MNILPALFCEPQICPVGKNYEEENSQSTSGSDNEGMYQKPKPVVID